MVTESDTLINATAAARRQVGPYVIDDVLGAGAMGVVYRGRAPDGTAVAIKVLHEHVATAEVVRRFEDEARVRIEHPNVVRLIDAGRDPDGSSFIVFEALDGESLDRRLDRETMAPSEAIEIATQVCRGLAAAHAQGVVHRDLKPGNLFRCRDGTVKLLDFGIARLTARENRRTAAGVVMGTPSYLSPEQARGEPDIDARTDLWAVGAVLYHALSGAPPFDRDTALATIVAVLMEEAEGAEAYIFLSARCGVLLTCGWGFRICWS